MKPFDGRIGKRLDYSIVGDLRFFAYYIGNETLLTNTKWGIDYNIELIFEPSDALGNIYALELFRNKGTQGNRQDNSQQIGTILSSTNLIGEYIQSLNNNSSFPIVLEQLQSPNKNNWRDVIVRFFKALGMRNLQTAPLLDYQGDYADVIITEGNYLEMTTAIFCNVLRMDQSFNVINEEWARHRTSQYIRYINDESDSYKVTPPFKQWEQELWM